MPIQLDITYRNLNIIFQKNPTNALDATINITLTATDYTADFEQAIMHRRARVNVKGFRTGQVPVALVKKLYGVAILEEIVGKLALKSLEAYLQEHAIKLWGQPILLSSDLHKPSFNLHVSSDLSMQFACALLSDINLEELKRIEVDHFKITSMEEDALEELVSKLQHEHGAQEDNIGISQLGDIVYGTLTKGSNFSRSIYLPATINSHDEPIGLLGIKPTETRTLQICTSHAYELPTEHKKLYGDHAQKNVKVLNNLEEGSYQFTVDNIQRTTPAELNTDFFDKVLKTTDDTVHTIASFKEALKEEVITSLQQVADDFLDHNFLQEALLQALPIELPTEYTRHYLLRQNPTADMASVDQWIANERAQLSWSLFTEQIIQAEQLQVAEEEVLEIAREELSKPTMSNPFVRSSTDAMRLAVLKSPTNENFKMYSQALYNRLLHYKIIQAVKEKVTIKTTETTMLNKQEFQKYAVKDRQLSSLHVEKYIDHIENMTRSVIEERPGHFREIDVFSRLIMDRIVFLGTPVDDHIANIIVAQLLFLESTDSKKDIRLYINSPGGSVYPGLGIYDTMQYIAPDVHTICTGLAASMAAVLLAGGASKKRYALPHSRILIHQPLGGAQGQASDMEITIKQMLEIKKDLYLILSKHTGKDPAVLEKDGDRDYWMRASEAKAYGLIDEVLVKHNQGA
eukprot:gene57-83_t